MIPLKGIRQRGKRTFVISERAGPASLEVSPGAHHRMPPSSGRSAERARAAVGWIALESSVWRGMQ